MPGREDPVGAGGETQRSADAPDLGAGDEAGYPIHDDQYPLESALYVPEDGAHWEDDLDPGREGES